MPCICKRSVTFVRCTTVVRLCYTPTSIYLPFGSSIQHLALSLLILVPSASPPHIASIIDPMSSEAAQSQCAESRMVVYSCQSHAKTRMCPNTLQKNRYKKISLLDTNIMPTIMILHCRYRCESHLRLRHAALYVLVPCQPQRYHCSLVSAAASSALS